MKWLIYFIGMMIWGYINGVFSSDKTANPWIKDDEREQKIKHKAIIASWSGIFMFCIISLFNKLLGLSGGEKSPYLPDPLATILKENVELQVLIILFIMYGVFYLYYRKKLSA
ncbi:phosphoglycerate mutase [Bacillus sp. NPDC094106]|uniref:phosphoglycerate mutase n=1 Tax=Bacillus sp. NPDC094106 TaxID=3363949 RepID=UPI00382296CD